MIWLAKKLSNAIVSRGIATEKDRELYEYSFLIMLEQTSVWLTILFLACVFGVLLETVIYMVLFIPLRVYAGGYHARTFSWCYIISVGVYVAFVVLQRLVTIPNLLALCTVLASTATILFLAPLADPNKPMDVPESVRFKRLVRLILSGELIVFILCLWLNSAAVTVSVTFAFFHLALLLIAGKALVK